MPLPVAEGQIPWTWLDVRYVALHSSAELQAEGVVCQLAFTLFSWVPSQVLLLWSCHNQLLERLLPSECRPKLVSLHCSLIPIRLHIVSSVSSVSPSLYVGRVPQLPTPTTSVYAHHPTWAIGPFTVAVAIGTGQCQLLLSL